MFGLVDVDLVDNGTRHPNLALLKIAGYLRDMNYQYQLVYDDSVNINDFDYLYVSKVFTFSKEPKFLNNFNRREAIFRGGTGYYADEKDPENFNRLRELDNSYLENDPFLPGFSMAHQMPDYNLYSNFVIKETLNGKDLKKFKDYQLFSIGFLTRGCIRKCPFCVNRNTNHIYNYSKLDEFVDRERPRIYLWDDNFLASANWKDHLIELNLCKKPFQFRQGLDIRLINDEKAEVLSKSRYYGDFIFAFDQLNEKDIIQKKLKIWKHYCPTKSTKLYLFCGFKISDSDDKFFEDVLSLFKRIEILMSYGCLGYVMRHSDHKNHHLSNMYTQIARWCNQPRFYKKMSFEEFIIRNQTYQEEKANTKKNCKALVTYTEFRCMYASRMDKIDYYFKMKFQHLINPKLWE